MRQQRKVLRWLALVLVFGLIAAGCGSDDDAAPADSSTDDAAPADSSTDDAAPADSSTDDVEDDVASAGSQPDVNGDGKVVIGIASPGDTNDGGFYQSFVDGTTAFAEAEGWEVVVSDFINPADAIVAIEDLARGGVDFLAVGASELQDGIEAVACEEEFSDVVFYINAELPEGQTCYGSAADFDYEFGYVGGIMAGLVLEREGATTAGYIGGPELAFSTVAHESMEAGMRAINPDFNLVVTHTGDFNDAALGIEAAAAMLDQNIRVIYTFLGGAMFATGGSIAGAGGIAFSAATNTCFPGSPFGGSVLFPPGEYLVGVLEDFRDGKFQEGVEREFHVGIDDAVGVALCDASAEEQARIDDIVAKIGSGELDPEAETTGS